MSITYLNKEERLRSYVFAEKQFSKDITKYNNQKEITIYFLKNYIKECNYPFALFHHHLEFAKGVLYTLNWRFAYHQTKEDFEGLLREIKQTNELYKETVNVILNELNKVENPSLEQMNLVSRFSEYIGDWTLSEPKELVEIFNDKECLDGYINQYNKLDEEEYYPGMDKLDQYYHRSKYENEHQREYGEGIQFEVRDEIDAFIWHRGGSKTIKEYKIEREALIKLIKKGSISKESLQFYVNEYKDYLKRINAQPIVQNNQNNDIEEMKDNPEEMKDDNDNDKEDNLNDLNKFYNTFVKEIAERRGENPDILMAEFTGYNKYNANGDEDVQYIYEGFE